MIAVSDSTPLIHLAKVGCIEILFSLYKEIIITYEVYREVVEEGKLLENEDAWIIEEYVGKHFHVKSPTTSSEYLIEKYVIHRGEADSIQLAKETGAELLLMNERDGRNAAKHEGLKVKGSIGILFEALKTGIINKEEVLSILGQFKDAPQVFWIEPAIIKAAIEQIILEK
jgi:predicted nucleic acid-binding protein